MVLPFVDRVRRVDMRTRAFNVPPQEVQCSCTIILSILFTLFKELYFGFYGAAYTTKTVWIVATLNSEVALDVVF